MRSIVVKCAIAMITVLGGVARGDSLAIHDSDHTLTRECRDNDDIAVFGSKNQLTLRGACAKVVVMGSGNTLRIDTTSELAISGSRNVVDVAATDDITVTGHDNRVSYGKGRASKAPRTSSMGKRNVIQKLGEPPGSAGGDAAPPPDDKPEATGSLREVKPILCQRNDRVNLDGVIIRTDGIAITTQGNCWLTIANSKIISTASTAVQTMGSTVVTFDNVELEGKHGAVMNAGSAVVTIKRSALRGALAIEGSSTVRLVNTTVYGTRSVTSSATYIDGGGNKFHKP